MRLFGWVRRRPVLAGFAAGLFLALVTLAVVGYLVFSDQRRTARVLAAALSRALAREVRIHRVTDVGAQRVVMRGVELPRDGGWPAHVLMDRVEATGPLLAVARGDVAPVRLAVAQPIVEVPRGGGGVDPAALEGLGPALALILTGPLQLDVTFTGGVAKYDGTATEFDLVLRKGSGVAHGELTLRAPRAAPLVLAIDARADGGTTRLALTGRGGLASLAAWLPAGAAELRDRALELALELDFGAQPGATARGSLAIGDRLALRGSATVKNGVVQAELPSASADLALAAAVAGLGWTPTGRAELSGMTITWRRDGAGPTIRAAVRVPTATLPAAGVGTDVFVERLEGRIALEPAGPGTVVAGDFRATRLRAGSLEATPIETRYRLGLQAGRLVRADLDGLALSLEGAALRGALGYDVAGRRLDARLGGDEVEAAGLVMRLAPGWLDAGDRLRLVGVRLTALALDPMTLETGTARLEALGLRWERPAGHLAGERFAAQLQFARAGATLALDVERVATVLPALTGEVPRVTASAELTHGAGPGLQARRATLTARDRQGQEMVVASLTPAPTAGRLRLSARAPALERLEGLWPTVSRRLNGSARLDVELPGTGGGAADGRLVLDVPEAEMWNGKVSVRDLAATVPVRRGSEILGEPPWGQLAIGELIAYGIVVRDLTTPARVYRDRLSLNDLTYALYAGNGKGWTEIAAQPDGLAARGQLTGERVRVEEVVSSYGIRGGTMTGLMRFATDYDYRGGRLQLKGHFEVPDGGAVNIELLDRVLGYAEPDPTGVVREALANLRTFDYKSAEADVQTVGDDIRVSLALRGRERFLILPPRVREINIRSMPLSFLARQFPGSFH